MKFPSKKLLLSALSASAIALPVLPLFPLAMIGIAGSSIGLLCRPFFAEDSPIATSNSSGSDQKAGTYLLKEEGISFGGIAAAVLMPHYTLAFTVGLSVLDSFGLSTKALQGFLGSMVNSALERNFSGSNPVSTSRAPSAASPRPTPTAPNQPDSTARV
jgi:hypothetical protein